MGELIALPTPRRGEVISFAKALDKRRGAHAAKALARYAAMCGCPEHSAVARHFLEVEDYFETGRPPAAFAWR